MCVCGWKCEHRNVSLLRKIYIDTEQWAHQPIERKKDNSNSSKWNINRRNEEIIKARPANNSTVMWRTRFYFLFVLGQHFSRSAYRRRTQKTHEEMKECFMENDRRKKNVENKRLEKCVFFSLLFWLLWLMEFCTLIPLIVQFFLFWATNNDWLAKTTANYRNTKTSAFLNKVHQMHVLSMTYPTTVSNCNA